MNLYQEKCIACSIETPPMKGEIVTRLLKELHEDWNLVDSIKLERVFKFHNFVDALDHVIKIGEIAEEDGHHPDFELGWGRVKVTLITHKIKGLSRNDFILAAKIDKIE